jgi:Mg2+ and Co2+ transporter CorA
MRKTPNTVLERTRFYEEIASGGMEYTPPAQYFRDVQDVMEDLIKQVNHLRERLNESEK